MEETIGFKDLIQILKKRIFLILSVMLIAAIGSGVVSYFLLTPEYKASTQILVNQAKTDQSLYNYNEVQTNIQLINTYSIIIKSAAILNDVRTGLDLDLSTDDLNKKITVESAQNSQIMTISVIDSDAATALKIANKTAEIFEKEIKKLMQVDNVSILPLADDQKNLPPVSPNPPLIILVATLVSFILGCGIAFLLEYFDNTVKNEQDIEKILNLPVLGAITTIDDTEFKKRNLQNGRNKGVN